MSKCTHEFGGAAPAIGRRKAEGKTVNETQQPSMVRTTQSKQTTNREKQIVRLEFQNVVISDNRSSMYNLPLFFTVQFIRLFLKLFHTMIYITSLIAKREQRRIVAIRLLLGYSP